MTNKKIISQLKNRNFTKDIKADILPVLERNAEKIVFIEEIQGLRDVLFFEEMNLEFYDFPFFLSLNVKTQISSPTSDTELYDNYSEIYNNAVTDTREIVKQLEDFFTNTKRTLFIEIGFSENELTNDEMWEVFNQMESGRDKQPFQIMKSMYQYPEWYEVKDSEEIAMIEDSIYHIRSAETHLIKEKLQMLKNSIDELLLAGAFKEIQKTQKEMSILEQQLEKTSL